MEQFILKENDLLKANCRDETKRELKLETQVWCPIKELVMHLPSALKVGPRRASLEHRWERIALSSFLPFFQKWDCGGTVAVTARPAWGFWFCFLSCVTCPNWQQDAAWFSSEHWPEKWETKACAVLGHCLAFWDMLPGLLVKAILICIIYQTWEGVESKMQ